MQIGFFEDEDRHSKLRKLGDPLPRLDSILDWLACRPLLTRARVEHVFGDQRFPPQGSILVWTKDNVGSAMQIWLMNLTHEMAVAGVSDQDAIRLLHGLSRWRRRIRRE